MRAEPSRALAVLAGVFLLGAAAMQGSWYDTTALAEPSPQQTDLRAAKTQAAKAYPRAVGFLQPLHPDVEAGREEQPDGSPAGSFGSDKVWPAQQVFHSNALFGSSNNFGPMSHFKEGSHFEDGNTFEDGASFGKDAHFGANNHFGKDTTVGKGSTIGAGAVFGEGAVIGQRSVFGPGVSVGAQSYIAGDQVFAGGDHFGAGISFGPNTRFGPNTEFDGDELFAAGSTFGDGTKFDWAGAGKDTFGGKHYFGVNTVWGDNEPQVSGGGPIRSPAAGKAGVDNSVVMGLPPGYEATAIPGVYQYSAATSAATTHEEPHSPDPDWHRKEPHSGGNTGWEWSHPQPAKIAQVRKASITRRQQKLARGSSPQAHVGAEGERWEVSRAAREMAAAAGAAAGKAAAASQLARDAHGRRPHSFGAGMARWLSSHAHDATGPSASLATLAARQRLNAKMGQSAQKRTHGEHKQSHRSMRAGAADQAHLDGIADRRVPVAQVEHPKPKGISFFSMFE